VGSSRGRLRDRRAHPRERGGQHRNDAAIRVPDQMRPALHEAGDVHRVELVVAPVDVRARPEAAPVDDPKLGHLGQRPLRSEAVLVRTPRPP